MTITVKLRCRSCECVYREAPGCPACGSDDSALAGVGVELPDGGKPVHSLGEFVRASGECSAPACLVRHEKLARVEAELSAMRRERQADRVTLERIRAALDTQEDV